MRDALTSGAGSLSQIDMYKLDHKDDVSKKEGAQLKALDAMYSDLLDSDPAKQQKAMKGLEALKSQLLEDGLDDEHKKMLEGAFGKINDIVGKPGHAEELSQAINDLCETIVMA
jgi:hypothetical protein